ncbi:MAG: hypothetical protein JNL03_03885, partial [Prolixibacteraceae bacterium]|nr:hypothetical protein [Prolixibacteraceae bacterium]
MEHESHELVKLHEGFRFFSYVLLFLSMYLNQLGYFTMHGLHIPAFHPLIAKLQNLTFLANVYKSKTVCLVFLAITCVGTKAHKDRELTVSSIVAQVVTGLILYWGSLVLFKSYPVSYLTLTFFGFVLLNIGFDNISKLINVNLMKDRFNVENESFPQEQILKENEYSVNLPTRYLYKDK